jgi:MiaB-like tRNA modifying enzyme
MYNAYVETYGCSANHNNSEIIKGLLARAGFNIVINEENADIIIVNTCIVKGPTINKIFERVRGLISEKKKLIIAGCMADVHSQIRNIKNIKKDSKPLVSFAGSHHIKEIARVAGNLLQGKEAELSAQKNEVKLCMPKIRQNEVTGITQILEGCLGNCNYCITRFAKGSLFSYPKEEIIRNIKEDLSSGCREIWLTSQDNAAYGLDAENGKNGETLIDLLKDILALKGRFFIRLGMMNPNHVVPILKDLIKCYKDDKMYKFLHLPLQSGSNKVLGEMDRKYNADDFLKIVERFRMHFPDLTLSTDIICGYPTETAEDFEKSLEIARKIQPDIVNISRYWPMPGTSASKLKQLAQEEIIRRTTELMKLFDNLAFEKNKKLVNKEYDCLVNKKGIDGTWLCRNKNYKLIGIRTKEKILGKIIKVKIKKATPHYLIGNILSQ